MDENEPTKKQKAAQEVGRGNKTHGIYSFQTRGPDALGPQERSYFLQIRDKFNAEPGRLEYRKDLAAMLATMLELGFADLRYKAERGYPIWTSPPVQRMGTYVNALIRLMDGWPKDQDQNKNILDLMNNGVNDNEQSKE